MTKVDKLAPIAGLIAMLLLSSSAYSSPNYKPPRDTQGHPNMQGTWDFRTLTPLERPKEMADKTVFTAEEEEAYRNKVTFVNDTDNKKDLDLPAHTDVEVPYNNFWLDFGTEMNEDRRTSLIVDPPNGRLPELTPAAMAGRQNYMLRVLPVREFFSIGLATFRPAGPESLGLSERCMVGFNAGPPLIPSAYNNNLRIIQTPSHVVLVTEMIHNARIVPIDGRPHLPKDISEWSGDSRGHWDGDTLVIETTNFTDKTPSFQLPISADDPTQIGAVGVGSKMHLTERFTLVGESRLVYEYTVNDPATFATPFTVAIPMRPTEDQMYEYACHEGNHAVVGMLNGARTLEKEEAAARN